MDQNRKNHKKINVLHLAVGLNPGGAEKLILDLTSRLDRAQFEIQVLSLKPLGPFAHELQKNGVRVTSVNGRGVWDVIGLMRAVRFVRTNRVHIIHSHLFWANMIGALIKGQSKLVWQIHDVGDWMNPILRAIEKAFLFRVDRIIAVSSAAHNSVLSRLPKAKDRLSIVYSGVEIQFGEIPTDPGKDQLKQQLLGTVALPVVGFVGRLDNRFKGLDTLVSAAALVVEKIPEARFAIIGEGNDKTMLKDAVTKAGLADSVLMLGQKLNLRDYYRCFDIFVLPSRSESLGLVLLEAMEASLPVVSTTVGGIPEVVENGNTGLLVPPNDAAALAAAILKILRDRDLGKRLGIQARRSVIEKFDIARTVKQTEAIYVECLKEESAAGMAFKSAP